MFIKFNKLVLHNFLSFGDAELALDNNGYTLVSGQNLNSSDSAFSNGAGKSAIFEAISWALIGSTIRGSRNIVNIHSNGGAYVRVLFDVDKTSYDILRSKDSEEFGTNLKIYIDNVDKSGKGIRESEKLLAEYLPDLTPSLIGSVIILGQGLPQRFSNNTPSGRKEVLETLSKSDFMIEDLKNRIAERKEALSTSYRKVEDSMLSLNSRCIILEENLGRYEDALSKISNIEDLSAQIKEQSEIVDSYSKKLASYEEEIASMENELNKQREDYIALQKEKSNALTLIVGEKNSYIAPLNIKKAELNVEIQNLQSTIDRLSKIKDICPTCGQKLPNVVKPNIDAELLEIGNLKQQYKETENEIAKVSLAYDKKLSECETDFNNKCESVAEIGKTKKYDLENLKGFAKKCRDSMVNAKEKCAKLIAEKDSLFERKRELEDSISRTKNELEKIDKQMNALESEASEIVKHEDVIRKFDTIIKRDFRGHLLKNVIEYTNTRTQEYSNDVFGKPSVSIELNGNNLDIRYSEKFYENLSGGEKQKVDIIVQLAIRDMLCKFLGFGCNILVIDECFDNLDEIGCQKVIDLISSTLKDIDSIYIITHHTDINLSYDKEIIVVKNEEGVSYIQ